MIAGLKTFWLVLWRRLLGKCPHDGTPLERWPEPGTFADWEDRCSTCGFRRSV